MKLGSLKEGGRDGTLIVVSRDLAKADCPGRVSELARGTPPRLYRTGVWIPLLGEAPAGANRI